MSQPWFDRSDLLAAISKRVQGFCAGYRQNLALIGPAGTGKSTLLKRFLEQELPAGAPLLPVYLEVGEEDNLVEWAGRFTRTLLYSILRMHGNLNFPAQIGGLLEDSGSLVPRTAELARQVLERAEGGRTDEAYDALWDLPALASQETGHRVLLVLEEFHRLRGLPVRDPFRAVGRRIMVQGSTLFLVTSSQPQVACSILREGLSLLFGKFETLEVPPLTDAACRRAVRAVLEGAGDPLLERILVELAQGQAHRLQLLLEALESRRPQDAGSVAAPLSVGEVLEGLFLDPGSTLRREFEMRLRVLPAHRVRPFCIEVLGTVASGMHRLPQISEEAGRSRAEVLRALRILLGLGLVSKRGVFYQVEDRLFGLWMSTAQPALQGAGLAGPEQTRLQFRGSAQRWIRRLEEDSVRPLTERLEELIGQWRGEWVEIEARRTLLPKLAEIRSLPAPFPFGGVVARRSAGGKGGWCAVVWARSLDEAQAGHLVRQLRGQAAWKGYRKVVLATHPVELNARLVLQGGKVRLWDLHVVNALMDLYGLTPIPLPEAAEPALSHPPEAGWGEPVRVTDRPSSGHEAPGDPGASLGSLG